MLYVCERDAVSTTCHVVYVECGRIVNAANLNILNLIFIHCEMSLFHSIRLYKLYCHLLAIGWNRSPEKQFSTLFCVAYKQKMPHYLHRFEIMLTFFNNFLILFEIFQLLLCVCNFYAASNTWTESNFIQP